MKKTVQFIKRGAAGAWRFVRRNSRGAITAGVLGGMAAATAAKAEGTFDVSTLYTGAAAAFGAAATIAGGFLAIKFGAKLVKKAWAWLT